MVVYPYRRYEYVVAITLELDKKEPLDRFFLNPTADFDENNLVIFCERDAVYSSYSLPKDKIEEKIVSLV